MLDGGHCGLWERPLGWALGPATTLTTLAPSHLFYLRGSHKPHHLKTGSPYFKNTSGEKHGFMSASPQGLSLSLWDRTTLGGAGLGWS